MTPEQAIKIKLDIDEKFFSDQLVAKVAGITAEINARTKQQKDTKKTKPWAPMIKSVRPKPPPMPPPPPRSRNDEKIAQAKKNLEALEGAGERSRCHHRQIQRQIVLGKAGAVA